MENDDGKKKREFEMTPEQATDIPAAAGWFDRKKVMVTICASIGAVVCVAMLINVNSASGGGAERDGSENPAVAPAGFVEGLRDRAVVRVATDAGLLARFSPGTSRRNRSRYRPWSSSGRLSYRLPHRPAPHSHHSPFRLKRFTRRRHPRHSRQPIRRLRQGIPASCRKE